MAKSSKRELDEIKSLLLEIDRIYQKIGISNPFSKDTAAQFVGQVNKLKDALEDANDVLHNMDDGIGDITKSWKAIIDEAKAYKNSIYSSKNALTSLSSISEKLMNHQKGISNLSSKQLKSLQEQAKANRESLNTNQDLLQSQINTIQNEYQMKIDKMYKEKEEFD
jgi:methyl-accepting chemotaxis protein